MEWNIAKSQRTCACGHELQENEAYVAAIYEEGESFARRDYCAECWPKAEAEGGQFSFWRTSVPAKEEKRRLFADDEVLIDFFLRLEHEQEEQRRHFFYLLALILMRKKILKFDDIEREDGQEFLCLRFVREDRTLRVQNPGLSEEQIEVVKAQLSEVLDIRV
ncbi:hypothetical protein HQ560_08290 [bacterium]|nr:hypothetical protein [bacterium]